MKSEMRSRFSFMSRLYCRSIPFPYNVQCTQIPQKSYKNPTKIPQKSYNRLILGHIANFLGDKSIARNHRAPLDITIKRWPHLLEAVEPQNIVSQLALISSLTTLRFARAPDVASLWHTAGFWTSLPTQKVLLGIA